MQVVANVHIKPTDLGLNDTLREWRNWVIDLRLKGISCSYVKACIDACGCQIIQKATPMDMVDFKIKEYNKHTKPCEVYEVNESKIKDMLSKIQIKHATC